MTDCEEVGAEKETELANSATSFQKGQASTMYAKAQKATKVAVSTEKNKKGQDDLLKAVKAICKSFKKHFKRLLMSLKDL